MENDNRICYCRTCNGIIHIVQKGDTLYKLARYYGSTVGTIIAQNPFINIYNLQVGSKLCIPIGLNNAQAMPRNMQTTQGNAAGNRGMDVSNDMDTEMEFDDIDIIEEE